MFAEGAYTVTGILLRGGGSRKRAQSGQYLMLHSSQAWVTWVGPAERQLQHSKHYAILKYLIVVLPCCISSASSLFEQIASCSQSLPSCSETK